MNKEILTSVRDRTQDYLSRIDNTLRDTLKQPVWFASLYTISLLCLTATGASVRWALSSI